MVLDDIVEPLKEQITKLESDKNEILKKSLELAEMVKTPEKLNGDLIDMTSLALKNYKEEQEKKKETTENK